MSYLVLKFPVTKLVRPTRRDGRAERREACRHIAETRIRDVARHFQLEPTSLTCGGHSPSRRCLAARQLIAYTLHEYDGLSYAEIARGLGVTATAIAYLVRRMRERLADGSVDPAEVVRDDDDTGEEQPS